MAGAIHDVIFVEVVDSKDNLPLEVALPTEKVGSVAQKQAGELIQQLSRIKAITGDKLIAYNDSNGSHFNGSEDEIKKLRGILAESYYKVKPKDLKVGFGFGIAPGFNMQRYGDIAATPENIDALIKVAKNAADNGQNLKEKIMEENGVKEIQYDYDMAQIELTIRNTLKKGMQNIQNRVLTP